MTDLLSWGVFAVVVVALLAFDLGVLHRKEREIGIAESLKLSAFYICAGLAFGAYIWFTRGPKDGLDYYTGFLVEKSLSMDNVFVISLIFTQLAIPRLHQHRVLFWGILGALVMRAIMIGVGATLVHEFSWILLIFGLFLLVTGFRMLLAREQEEDIHNSKLYQFLKARLRLTDRLYDHHFMVDGTQHGLAPGRWVTPLLLALLMVEGVDLIFAVDSIPAIFAITQDPFVVYTSNIFAILGLRALYFALASMVHRFEYLKYALALVLIFIGTKIGLVHAGIAVPAALSLSVTFGLLLAGVLYSMWRTRGQLKPRH
ncbi:TerC family protein [Amantichitinum ursilacus]|uniref:Inner membrane protein alx n=1 Tax=Amantichitinum ursilacus TaxID=857265 RepID=A0A0N0XH63_9NEIS|nr:TerC family protein [Amantichitinum ursilacus]KPC50803.1 Inner membrane protein alx [Amantichitinum ursilacus]